MRFFFWENADGFQYVFSSQVEEFFRIFADGKLGGKGAAYPAGKTAIGERRSLVDTTIVKAKKDFHGITAFSGNLSMGVGIIHLSTELRMLPAIKSFLTIDLFGFETYFFLNIVYNGIILFVSHGFSQISKYII